MNRVKNNSKVAMLAAMFAITFTLSCGGSNDDPDNGGDNNNGGGISSQVYNGDGTKYTGNGIIKIRLGYDDSDNIILINVGSITNGVIKFEFPKIPDKYLEEFLEEGERSKRTCTDYPEGIKSFFVDSFDLANSNGEVIGEFGNYHEYGEPYTDGSFEEIIYYAYFTKTGKVACSYTAGPHRTQIFNIDAKEGWNTIYYHRTYPNGISAEEISTNNILTKELKWVLY
jgi:hypothetical protein